MTILSSTPRHSMIVWWSSFI